MAAQHSQKPLCSLGLLADSHYADIDNGQNYRKTRVRYYRTSLTLLRNAIAELSKPEHDIQFIVQLGDLIDGLCKVKSPGSQESLARTLSEFKPFHNPVYHVWGNHEFYNFSRSKLLRGDLNSACHPSVNGPAPDKANYYEFSPAKGLRLVVLDQYEVSMLGYHADSVEYKEAESILRKVNCNEVANSPIGLEGSDERFVQFNGGIGEEQMAWLDGVLQQADVQQERVIILGHLPLFEPSSCWLCMCWNYADILDVLHKHRSVVACIAGHDHDGGHSVDSNGVHHVTLPGIIETAPDDNAFGILHVKVDRMELQGFGRMPSSTMAFQQWD